jgi:hypothetical protein
VIEAGGFSTRKIEGETPDTTRPVKVYFLDGQSKMRGWHMVVPTVYT